MHAGKSVILYAITERREKENTKIKKAKIKTSIIYIIVYNKNNIKRKYLLLFIII